MTRWTRSGRITIEEERGAYRSSIIQWSIFAMKFNPLGLMFSLVMLIPLIGILLGLSISIAFPLWIAAIAIEVVLTLVIWHKEGRSFKPLAPLSLVLIGALAIVAVWAYFQP